MNKLAVLTSGGDAPGMNAAIRSVVRTAICEGLEVLGFHRGFDGVISQVYQQLDVRMVGGILEGGGTVLRTMRSPEFKTEAGMKKAVNNLERLGIDGLVVIGGDGSLRGADALNEIWSGQVVGVPASIDNDIGGCDLCIGFDTAVNTALESVDRIRDTATSHERLFIIEVMGRASGHIALSVGLAGGAEEILIPEVEYSVDNIVDRVKKARSKGKLHYIIILAEGAGKGFKLADQLGQKSGMDTRVAVLGHIQRGGTPTAFDRIIGAKMGTYAVKTLLEGKTGVCTGIRAGRRNLVALSEAAAGKPLSQENLELSQTLCI